MRKPDGRLPLALPPQPTPLQITTGLAQNPQTGEYAVYLQLGSQQYPLDLVAATQVAMGLQVAVAQALQQRLGGLGRHQILVPPGPIGRA